MGSLIKGFSKPPLKQWVIYKGVDVCTGIVVSRKLKIIRKKIFSQKLLEVKESTSVEGPTNCKATTSTTRQCNNNNNTNNIKERLVWSG